MDPGSGIRTLAIHQPRKLVFGNGCASQFVEDFSQSGLRRVFLVTAQPVLPVVGPIVEALEGSGANLRIWDGIDAEPTIEMFEDGRRAAREFRAEAVVGVGGGSVLDAAKLIAALHNSEQDVQSAFGIGNLSGRTTHLACLPTTSGTGSEVSPNAILLDGAEQLKKGVISPHLVPDGSYVDPLLTVTVPPHLTASTGMDALTHCIEAYANRSAHPMIDLYALEGIRLIGANLRLAYDDGGNKEARANVALGSLYGGLCLGPVNTGAVHALAYPLGGEFHVSHGVSNSLLLPHVLEFNLPAAPERYAQAGLALGVDPGSSDAETAQRGLARIRELSEECGIPTALSQIGIPRNAIERMAEAAMTVTRLLKNNPREMTVQDAEQIYGNAY